jgi:hypothetical protein
MENNSYNYLRIGILEQIFSNPETQKFIFRDHCHRKVVGQQRRLSRYVKDSKRLSGKLNTQTSATNNERLYISLTGDK